jgi:hypothetical protein
VNLEYGNLQRLVSPDPPLHSLEAGAEFVVALL